MIEYTVRVNKNGDKYWYLNDKLHREDGPAVEWASGDRHWYIKNERHREDGPAIEWADGDKYWYINGEYLTENQFNALMNPSCSGKTAEIDGVKYKLVEVSNE
jgi:hypothetical protein